MSGKDREIFSKTPHSTLVSSGASAGVGDVGIGSRVGPYKLLELLGEGGFGLVYLAEQTQPVHRRVAVKVIKQGMDTKQVIARFQAERQALALMDHPNITRVLDLGVTESGRPYFAMELVRGLPINRFCDRQLLPIRTRLKLFVSVCQAVQHAHQKGVIHRDLKPSNVLVSEIDGVPAARIIDFGIATAIGDLRLTDDPAQTHLHQLIGTPLYMSPEQASPTAEGIDTRSDVYSLGVMLYELLAGTTPFDPKSLQNAADAEVQRVIREVDPPKPSTRVGSLSQTIAEVASQRGTAPGSLRSSLRGELDWIVMKCLQKDRGMRYDSASALAADVQAYLSGAAVSAAPPSRLYRVRKFIRQNALIVGAAAAIVIALAGGLAVTVLSWQQVRLEQQRTRRAVQEADRQRQEAIDATQVAGDVNRFLNDMLSSADPDETRGKPLTVQALLDQTAGAIGGKFAGRPLVEASIRETIGRTYAALNEHRPAFTHLKAAAELRESVGRAEDPEHLVARAMLANETHMVGKFDEADKLYAKVLADSIKLLQDDSSDLAPAVDVLWDAAGQVTADPKDLAEVFRLAADRRSSLLGEDNPATIVCREAMAWQLAQLGRLEEAETMLRDALTRHRKARAPTDWRTLWCQLRLGRLLAAMNRDDEAFSISRDAVRRADEVYGVDHPNSLNALEQLTRLYEDATRFEESMVLRKQAYERILRIYGPDSSKSIATLSSLATLNDKLDRVDETERYLREQFQTVSRINGPDDLLTVFSGMHLGRHLAKFGQPQEAAPLLAEMIGKMTEKIRGDAPSVLEAKNWLAKALDQLGRTDESIALARETYDRAIANSRPADAKDMAVVTALLGPILVGRARFADAEPPLREALRRLEATGQMHLMPSRIVLQSLLKVCDETGRTDEAAQIRARLAGLVTVTRPTRQRQIKLNNG